jgi:cysteinyl-tRNA synthetase
MAMKYLGETLDIHAGGIDLAFPHHENEIAQSEAITGKRFVRYWLHAEHLIVEGQKMSKSLGNFLTLRDLFEKGYAPEAIRYLLASVPYRKKLNFTFDGLKAAATTIDRLRNFKLRLETEKFAEGRTDAVIHRSEAALAQFDSSLDDDLNTAEALATIFEYVRDANSAMDSAEFRSGNIGDASAVLDRFDGIFDVLKPSAADTGSEDADIEALIAERQNARKQRNFQRSDEIRNELLNKGIILEDTKEGVRWKRKQS